MPKFIFQQSKFPPFGSQFGKRLARDLWNFKVYCHDGRRPRESYVRECDDAYLCRRWIPDTGAAELIENGESGESDLHDNANLVSIRLALSLMPRNDPWLSVEALENEEEAVTKNIQDWQMFLHHKARTRRNVQRVIKQGYVRGSTYLTYDWHTEYRNRRLTTAEHTAKISEFLQEQGLPPQAAKKFAIGRAREVVFNGPVIQPVDFFDVWVEPLTDIVNNRRPTTILQRFKHKAKLLAEVDDYGKKVYSNLDDVEPFPLEEIYHNRDLAGGRPASSRIFGAPPSSSGVKLVPVYIFYLPYYKTDDGLEMWDTYVHIALSAKGNSPHVIRIEENPTGLNHLLMDHYVDWFVPSSYGLSGIEFQVSKYNQKNFLQLLMITAAAHSVMPPKLVLESAFRDPEEIDFGAGGAIPVLDNPLGLDVIKDLPGWQQGAMFGEQILRFYGEDLKASAGVDGLVSDNPARSMGKEKTATEVNRDVTSGSFFLDNQAENMNEMLSELCMGIYELSTQNILPSEDNPSQIEFEKYLGDRVLRSRLEIQDIQAKRSVQVRGINGQLNKQQETQNLLQMFQVASQIQDPWAGSVKLFIAQKLATKLNVSLPPELQMSPAQAVAMNPQVQIAAIQQGLQNPEVMQAIAQGIQGINAGPSQISQAQRVGSGAPAAPGTP